MKKDVGVSRRTDADAGVCWVLHGSVEERGGAGRREEKEQDFGTVREQEGRGGTLMVRDYIYHFNLTRSRRGCENLMSEPYLSFLF